MARKCYKIKILVGPNVIGEGSITIQPKTYLPNKSAALEADQIAFDIENGINMDACQSVRLHIESAGDSE